ncbi:MAG: hypothetical protein AAGE86_05785 [Pseudomonadota bacterium]
MAIRTPKQLVGVTDGTLIPPKMADGREVGAAVTKSVFSKVTGTAWASGDTVSLGKKPFGHKVTSIKLVTGTSLGSATIDVGTEADPDKYVDGATLTATNALTEIGVMAAAMAEDPGEAEDLIATIGGAAIAAGTELTFVVETVGMS